MLTNKAIRRVALPHEPGEWIDVRMPSIKILGDAQRQHGDDAIGLTLALVVACVTAWSYEDPVTADNVQELDGETARLVAETLMGTATAPVPDADPDVEKKESTDDSTMPSMAMANRRTSG